MHTVSHEHSLRDTQDPCLHEGPCSAARGCPCVKAKLLCERFCGCTAETCIYKFTGCGCSSSGKTCNTSQREGKPCICLLLNRECDPVLCKGCGAFDRANPQNAEDDELHKTGCQNVDLQRQRSKVVVLCESQLQGCGYGLITAEDIAADEYVIEYVGELISHDEGVRREAARGNVLSEDPVTSYVFTLLDKEGTWVDAAIYGNLSRYINHAPDTGKGGVCNLTPKVLYVNHEFRIRFRATRDIRAGEELFFDYGKHFPNLTRRLLDNKAVVTDDDDDGLTASEKKRRGEADLAPEGRWPRESSRRPAGRGAQGGATSPRGLGRGGRV